MGKGGGASSSSVESNGPEEDWGCLWGFFGCG